MEANPEQDKQAEDTEDYILLDLDDVCVQSDIPPNAPYVLSGLDTLTPILVIGDRLKLIGEYRETIGTCLLFSESDDGRMVVYPETGPSEANLFKDKCIVDQNKESSKQVKPVAILHKILKFRPATNNDIRNANKVASEIL